MSSQKISVIFFGTPQFAAISLQALLDAGFQVTAAVTQADKPAGRGRHLTASPVKECAMRSGIPVLQPVGIRKDLYAFLEEASRFGPFDIGVVAAFGQILPEAVLSLPANGCINVHASLLPRWRGAAPIQRAIMSGDSRTGVCLMRMEAGLDTGPVLAREEVPITDEDTFGTLHDTLAKAGADLLVNNLQRVCCKELTGIPQPEEGITYARKLEKAEEEIDWSKTAIEIRNLVRAFSPFPGAYTIIQGKRIKILDGEAIADGTADSSEPGVVLSADRRTFVVACASGSLSVRSVQPEGKRKMTVAEWLAGAGLRLGARIGKA